MENLPDLPSELLHDPAFLDPSLPSGLWWCENAYEVQEVGINAVALPLAGNWDDVKKCHDFISKFSFVFVATPNLHIQQEVCRHIAYLPVYLPSPAAFRGYSSVRALRAACGPEAVEKLLMGAVQQASPGLLNIADVHSRDLSTVPRTLSGFHELDRRIGGFFAGNLSVWTGKRGEGKSTLLGELLLSSIDQGHRVCVYSGEMQADDFKNWLSLQAAGPKNVQQIIEPDSGLTYYTVPPATQAVIDEWWDQRLWLFDLQSETVHDPDSILERFEFATRAYGCDVFLVDNIMTVQLRGQRDMDYFRAQSDFTRRLTKFSKANDVHVHLVAHPRKTQGGKAISDNDDVGGTGDITNLADNVFSIYRLTPSEAEQNGCSSMLLVTKNRGFGIKAKIGLKFEPRSRRFYSPKKTADFDYGWARLEQMQMKEVTEPTPFEETG